MFKTGLKCQSIPNKKKVHQNLQIPLGFQVTEVQTWPRPALDGEIIPLL